MAPFLNILLFGALASTNNKTSQQQQNEPILLEVCLSPGCVADGGEATLKKCMALAPPDLIKIKKGGCVSACGNGPVIRTNEKSIHKRVSDVVPLLEKLLLSSCDDSSSDETTRSVVPQELVQGYNMIMEADEAMEQKQFKEAVSFYKDGIDLALETAVKTSMEQHNFSEVTTKQTPSNLEWIVEAFCGLARAKLYLKDYNGALDAANKACDLSYFSDSKCLELVAEICQESNDPQKEMQALQQLFAIPIEGDLPLNIANRRRTQGFRLAKLERETAV